MSSYDGDLVITLDSGLEITITNDMLVLPHTYLDQDTGDLVAEDTTEPDLLIDSLQASRESDMASFGSVFFSAAYLSVNLDAGRFRLWSANVDTQNSTQDFRALDAENAEATTFCQAGSAPTTSDVTSGTAVPDDEQGKLSTGATAGISVGVIVAVIGAVGGFVLYWMRGRKRPAAYMAADMGDTSAASSHKELPPGNYRQQPVESWMFELQDAHSVGHHRQEVHEDWVNKYEMPEDARSGGYQSRELHEDWVQKYEMPEDARSGGYHRRELHEDWVQKYEMPGSGPSPRHELSG